MQMALAVLMLQATMLVGVLLLEGVEVEVEDRHHLESVVLAISIDQGCQKYQLLR